MTTFISDDPAWAAGYPPAPGFKQPPVRDFLEKGFEPEAEFMLYEGLPYIVWGDWDYAECWGPGPIREVHPFEPYWRGTKISEAEFRALVRTIHGITD